MEVILLEKIGRLGDVGDKVSVKAGYGRNFLIPHGKAVSANAENLAAFEERRAELEAAASDKLKIAETRAAAIAEVGSVTISANASDEGKLFGSVGTREISDAFTEAGAEVNKAEVMLPTGPIHEVGEFDIDVQLHTDVTQSVKVIVLAE